MNRRGAPVLEWLMVALVVVALLALMGAATTCTPCEGYRYHPTQYVPARCLSYFTQGAK